MKNIEDAEKQAEKYGHIPYEKALKIAYKTKWKILDNNLHVDIIPVKDIQYYNIEWTEPTYCFESKYYTYELYTFIIQKGLTKEFAKYVVECHNNILNNIIHE